MKKEVIKKIAATALTLAVTAGTPITAFATSGESNIPNKSIPVTAQISSYYEVVTDASIPMTQAYNNYITTTNNGVNADKATTFYGLSTISMWGVVGSGKKITVDLTCSPLKDGADGTKEAGVDLYKVTDVDEQVQVKNLWDESITDKSGNSVSRTVDDYTAGATGVSYEREAGSVDEDHADKYLTLLRTTLPYDGSYETALEIDFSLTNAD